MERLCQRRMSRADTAEVGKATVKDALPEQFSVRGEAGSG